MKYTISYTENKKEIVCTKIEKTESLDLKNIIAIRVKEKRKQLKMNQEEVAKQFGIVQNGISRIENGYKLISIGTLEKLCKIFHCKSSDILPF